MMDQDNITWTGARAPGVGGVTHRVAVHYRAHGPAQYGTTDVGYAMHERRRQTKRRPAYAGSRLKLTDALGRSRLISQPSSRTGGMVKPSVLAVLRLIVNSNVVGCSTGKSAGSGPFSILST